VCGHVRTKKLLLCVNLCWILRSDQIISVSDELRSIELDLIATSRSVEVGTSLIRSIERFDLLEMMCESCWIVGRTIQIQDEL
jgi:hypothetical protein